jgi:hypothetical protein
MEKFTIKEAIEGKHFPLSIRHLRNLIYRGEEKKQGKDVGVDYIRAINIGSIKMPRWLIEKEEIEAWILRKAKVKDKVKTK